MDIQTLIFVIIAGALAIFFLVYLPYKNGKGPEISDMMPIDDREKNVRDLCETSHRNAWRMLTKEEKSNIQQIFEEEFPYTHYCLVCERYR